ncbi:MAG TPA: hypothetical protein VGM30_10585 [Puia sp.]|jgi:hypothetical protein
MDDSTKQKIIEWVNSEMDDYRREDPSSWRTLMVEDAIGKFGDFKGPDDVNDEIALVVRQVLNGDL